MATDGLDLLFRGQVLNIISKFREKDIGASAILNLSSEDLNVLLDTVEATVDERLTVKTAVTSVNTAAKAAVSAAVNAAATATRSFGVVRSPPPTETLHAWLKEHELPRGATWDHLQTWLSSAPVSRLVKDFIQKHLYRVEEDKLFVPEEIQSVFRRIDYQHLFLKHRSYRVLVISGKRRQGKTCGLPMELLRARSAVYGVQDKAVFYHSGRKELPFSSMESVDNMIKMLTHMRVSACWDEFTNLTYNLSLRYKLLLEDRDLPSEPLTALLFGSDELLVAKDGKYVTNAICRFGGIGIKLSEPDLQVIAGIFNQRHFGRSNFNQQRWQEKSTCELFLRTFSIYGFNLKQHMLDRPSWDEIKEMSLKDLTSLEDEKVRALSSLVENKGDGKWIDRVILQRLVQEGYVVREAGASSKGPWTFTDPQLIMHQYRSDDAELEVAEGLVFETMVVKLFPLVLKRIARELGVEEVDKDVMPSASETFYGDSGRLCKVDVFSFTDPHQNKVAVVISSRREWRDDRDWATFGFALFRLLNGSHSGKEVLEGADKILCVGISALPCVNSEPSESELTQFRLYEDGDVYYFGVKTCRRENAEEARQLVIGKGFSESSLDKWVSDNRGTLEDMSKELFRCCTTTTFSLKEKEKQIKNRLKSVITPTEFKLVLMTELLSDLPELEWGTIS